MAQGRWGSARWLTGAAVDDVRRLFLPIAVVGLTGGTVGTAYVLLMQTLQGWLGPERWALWPHLLVLVAVGLGVALIGRLVGPGGSMELLVDNIHVLGGRRQYRELRSLVPTSLMCIGAGGAMGPEAPLVQTTGVLATWLAERRGASRRDRRVLTITGMAAGFTVVFGAPLGAAVFALEILHRRGIEYYEALMPAIIGALWGYAVFAVASGLGLRPIWQFPAGAPIAASDIGWALVAGAGGAALAALFTVLVDLARRLFARLPVGVRPVLGGLGLGLLAFWSPYALTFGEAQIGDLVGAQPVVTLMLVAAAAKMLGTVLTLTSEWKGGFIIPLFFIGMAVAQAVHAAVPQTNQVMLIAAFMVAVNTGVTKTPLGSTLVVTRMAGLQLLPTTLLAAVVALLLSSQVGLIRTQRRRDEHPRSGEPRADLEAAAQRPNP
jgi:chloride channel protein, CIC family